MMPTSELMARATQAVLAIIGVDDRASARQAVVSPATHQMAADIARAVIEAIPDLRCSRRKLRWRPIDENTPRHGNYARVSVEEGLLYCPHGGEATYWLPLPPPPDELEEEAGGRVASDEPDEALMMPAVCDCADVCKIPAGQPQPIASCRGLENQIAPEPDG